MMDVIFQKCEWAIQTIKLKVPGAIYHAHVALEPHPPTPGGGDGWSRKGTQSTAQPRILVQLTWVMAGWGWGGDASCSWNGNAQYDDWLDGQLRTGCKKKLGAYPSANYSSPSFTIYSHPLVNLRTPPTPYLGIPHPPPNRSATNLHDVASTGLHRLPSRRGTCKPYIPQAENSSGVTLQATEPTRVG